MQELFDSGGQHEGSNELAFQSSASSSLTATCLCTVILLKYISDVKHIPNAGRTVTPYNGTEKHGYGIEWCNFVFLESRLIRLFRDGSDIFVPIIQSLQTLNNLHLEAPKGYTSIPFQKYQPSIIASSNTCMYTSSQARSFQIQHDEQ